jgi:hypothetical protein
VREHILVSFSTKGIGVASLFLLDSSETVAVRHCALRHRTIENLRIVGMRLFERLDEGAALPVEPISVFAMRDLVHDPRP